MFRSLLSLMLLLTPAITWAASSTEVDEALKRAKEFVYAEMKDGTWETAAAIDRVEAAGVLIGKQGRSAADKGRTDGRGGRPSGKTVRASATG